LLVPASTFAAEPSVEPKIKWSDNLFASFKRASDAQKPLVVLFTADNLPYSEQLEEGIVQPGVLDRYADEAVFVRAKLHYEDANRNHAKLRKELGIEEFPVLVMLDATPEELKEVGRVVGYYPADRYLLKVGGSSRTPSAG
jgi:hypothetical protein